LARNGAILRDRIWYGGGEDDPSLDEKPERRTSSAPSRVEAVEESRNKGE